MRRLVALAAGCALLVGAACGGQKQQVHASSAADVGEAPVPVGTTQTTGADLSTTLDLTGADAPTGSMRRLPKEAIQDDAPPGPQTPMEWRNRYPFAARELVAWSKAHERLSDELATWEKTEPDKARPLVEWAVTHAYEGLGAFLMQREGWDRLNEIRARDPEGMEAFLDWARRAPKAAEEMVGHAQGFSTAVALRASPKAQRGEPMREPHEH